MWLVSPGRCPGAAGWGWVGVRQGRSRHWSGCFTSPSLTRVESAFFSDGEIGDFSSAPGRTSPPSPSSSTLVWVGSFLLLPVTPGKCRVWGVEICVGTLPLWALVSDLLSGPSCPAVLPASPGRGLYTLASAEGLTGFLLPPSARPTPRPASLPSHVGVSHFIP